MGKRRTRTKAGKAPARAPKSSERAARGERAEASRLDAEAGERAQAGERAADSSEPAAGPPASEAAGARGARLAQRALDAAGEDPELRAAIEKLSPEEAEMFLAIVERSLKKRKLLLIGYALAVAAMIVGLPVALLLYGNREPGEFGGWYFLIPFVAVGAVLVVFGRLARKL